MIFLLNDAANVVSCCIQLFFQRCVFNFSD